MRINLPSLAFLTVFSIILVLASIVLSVRPVLAAPIFEDGFETGDLSKWYPIGGSPSVTSGDAHHGTYKAVLDASGEWAQARFTFTPIGHGFMRAYVMFKSFPQTGAQTAILGLYNWANYAYMAEARVINVAGTIKWALRYYHNGVHYLAISEQQNPVLDTWYCVEVEAISNTTTNAESRVYIDGDELTDVSQTGRNNAYTITCAYIWMNYPGVCQWYDCVVVDTSYVGPECTLTINIAGSGTVAKNPDQDPYVWGTNVTLTATPTIGWSFAHWSGDAAGTVNPLIVNMTSDKTITATFTQDTYTLSVSTVGNGAVNLNNSGPYYYGDVVELTAVPSAGWSFQGWSGDLSGSANPNTIVMDGNKAVTATFTQNVYSLTVNVVGSGSVGLNKTGPYYYGDVVELTANADLGWVFSHWSGDLTGSANPATITMDGDKTVTATFVQEEYTLTIILGGSGSVNLNNSGPYYYGDVVELTANADPGWAFLGWTGDLTGTDNPATIVMTGNTTVAATFAMTEYTLTVNIIGDGAVNVNFTGPYHYNDMVKLTATADAGWAFQGWSGDLSGSTNPATLLIDGDKTVTATFTQNVYTLTTNVVGSGSVTRSTSGPYHYGDTVELTAVPNTGWIFDHWSGDLSGSTNPATIQITGNKAVTATFTSSAPVGGHSIHISIGDMVQPAAAYSVLICLFGAMLAALRRKRK